MIDRPSPNHAGPRALTLGCVLHSTRGGARSDEVEFAATLGWFASPASQVSAHVVIAADGTMAVCVDPSLIAWHARSPANDTMLGAELTQPHHGDPISDAQYATLAWWLTMMAQQFGFDLVAENLPQHKDIPAGIAEGKTDIDAPFDINRLLALL